MMCDLISIIFSLCFYIIFHYSVYNICIDCVTLKDCLFILYKTQKQMCDIYVCIETPFRNAAAILYIVAHWMI